MVAACNKSSDDGDDDETPGDFGDLTFYINEAFPCNFILVTLTDSGGNDTTLTLPGGSVHPSTPTCFESPSITFANRPYDVYTFAYTCDAQTISGSVGVSTDCFVVKMIN